MPVKLKTPRSHAEGVADATDRPRTGPVVVPEKSRGERRTSFDVADFPLPTGREEDWRFTPIDRLQPLFQVAPSVAEAIGIDTHLPEGFSVEEVPAGDERLGRVLRPADRASVVAWSSLRSGTLVSVPAEAEITEPARLTVRGSEHARLNSHLAVEVGAHSTSTILVTHEGSTECTGNVEISVGDGAHLTLVSLHEWDDDSVHLSQHDVRVGRDATFKHIVVTLGGALVRVCTNVRYAGPGGNVECLGVYFTDEGQHQEHRLFVDHQATHCVSNVEYRGALRGENAHSVWVGDVLIRAEAEGTDTYELNRNLVLTDGARADSVPNLEIETGNIVGAGHAAATGRFDDEQLFYLQSRGIPEREARRLVVHGFFADIVNRIGVVDTQTRLMEVIDRELEGSVDAAFAAPAGAAR